MNAEIFKRLICPAERTPLTLAEPALLAQVNAAIAAGGVTNRGGKTVERPLEAALVRADFALIYPILDEIPVLLADEGIPLAQMRIQRS